MIERHLLKILIPALAFAFVLSAGNAFALYEPVSPLATNAVVGLNPVKGPAEDLEIQWTAPTMGAGDSIERYVYKWTTSATPLDATQLNRDENDGEVPGALDPPFLITPKSFFANDDEDVLRYLHIKTAYISTTGATPGPMLSDGVVLGPFNFDNVKPDGSVTLDADAAGQTANSSSVNPVTLKVAAASAFTAKVYLSNTSTRPAAAKESFLGTTTVTHTVTEGAGSKTIYYWIEDFAGNISDPKTLTFTMIAGKSMNPSGDLQLDSGGTQVFTISGKGVAETFDWSFVDASTEGVASFVGDALNVGEVTVKGEKDGTFKVKAVSKDDGLEYTSGTVTVVLIGVKGDVNGDGLFTIDDVRLAFRFFLGLETPTPAQFYAAKIYGDGPSITIDDVRGVFRIFLGLPI